MTMTTIMMMVVVMMRTMMVVVMMMMMTRMVMMMMMMVMMMMMEIRTMMVFSQLVFSFAKSASSGSIPPALAEEPTVRYFHFLNPLQNKNP